VTSKGSLRLSRQVCPLVVVGAARPSLASRWRREKTGVKSFSVLGIVPYDAFGPRPSVKGV